MKRPMFHAAVAVSLLLLVLTLAAWVRSYFRYDDFNRKSLDPTTGQRRMTAVILDRGRLIVLRRRFSAGTDPDAVGWLSIPRVEPSLANRPPAYSWNVFLWDSLDDVYPRGSSAQSFGGWTFGIQMGPVAVLMAILPAVWLCGRLPLIERARRRRAMLAGRCARCGYDLRASGERCPECATPIPEESRAVAET